MTHEELSVRLQNIQADIQRLAWDAKQTQLVAVSKTVDAATTNMLCEHGQFLIGENRVQVIQQKLPNLDKRLQLHFIGRLQTNKIRYIIKDVSLFHSIDRPHLAEELNAVALQNNLCKDVLLQVNIGEEKQKAGFAKEEVIDFLQKASQYNGLHFRGLMAILPFIENEIELATYFKQMRQLFDHIKELAPNNVDMHFLSMGMTHDYSIALQEGANMLRIGSAIFHE
ncbi:MAG: YggS family pyridoxal phosphate-dependent enzyme [Eubacteriales bacterium]|nr:YggS family pyridoxal phosphate-dependent enzyme [Eubacteriales bacterium]